MRKIDVEVQNEGSIIVLYPRTKRAKEWFAEKVDNAGLTWCGGVPVEWRYADNILCGASADGLRVGAYGQ